MNSKSDIWTFTDFIIIPFEFKFTNISQSFFALLATTLLFIDEIQAHPEAIALLRYFYEDMPALHVIAAGSLLEHALAQVRSFPVGRVQYLYLFPMNFQWY